jgi:hypothetical protein
MPLSDYAVKFGRDPVQGMEGVNAFPFFYSLVNTNDVNWTPGLTPPDLSPYAVKCIAGAMTPHYVRLDPDYNYKLIAIKYSAYMVTRAGGYAWYGDTGQFNTYLDPGVDYGGDFLARNIQVSLSVQGSGSTTLFGGQNVQGASGNSDQKIPLALECMQGYESGFQALRCEYLLPLQAILSFEFTNTLPADPGGRNDLYVAAMMYGMKIRL